ncbi:MAG: hypothetical protein HZB62_02780 [Nitrospirae bacterium]|nr:hypothetical protein [Nitrospirota bacterium]
MMSLEQRLDRAYTAQDEELWLLVRDAHPQVILNVTLNRSLNEEMAVFLAKARSTPAEALGFLAGDVRFKHCYKLQLALCRNPRTPLRVVFSLLKFIRLFDLGDLTKNQAVPVTVRQKIELMLAEKIPSMPSGVCIALAKRSSSTIVIAIMGRGDGSVVNACLDSTVITETHLCEIINKRSVKPMVVRMIAEHPKWSLRYAVKYSLIRNFHTPMTHVARFIPDMKTNDLRELYSYESLPKSTRPFLFSELRDRCETVEMPEELTYEISEDDDLDNSDAISFHEA